MPRLLPDEKTRTSAKAGACHMGGRYSCLSGEPPARPTKSHAHKFQPKGGRRDVSESTSVKLSE